MQEGCTWLRATKILQTGHKVFGKCEMKFTEWKDKICYKVEAGEKFDTCVKNERGKIVI